MFFRSQFHLNLLRHAKHTQSKPVHSLFSCLWTISSALCHLLIECVSVSFATRIQIAIMLLTHIFALSQFDTNSNSHSASFFFSMMYLHYRKSMVSNQPPVSKNRMGDLVRQNYLNCMCRSLLQSAEEKENYALWSCRNECYSVRKSAFSIFWKYMNFNAVLLWTLFQWTWIVRSQWGDEKLALLFVGLKNSHSDCSPRYAP